MDLIPDEELKQCGSLNLAPMVDFLFLVVAVFATLAVTKAALFDKQIQLVKVDVAADESTLTHHQDRYIVNLSINAQGDYKWLTEFNEYLLSGTIGIQNELKRQQQLGLLPQDTSKTTVLLHIDKQAAWEAISDAIFAVRKSGFTIHPVYDYDESVPKT